MKIIRINVLLVLLLFCADRNIYAQITDPLSFFPHHNGNTWEYVEFEDLVGPVDTFQVKIVSDSLDNDGRFHITRLWNDSGFETYENIILDTNTTEVYGNLIGGNYGLLYKLNALLGDSWIAANIPGLGAISVTVTSIYQDITFGNEVTVKVFYFTDSTSGLWFGTHYLASGFGYLGQDFEFGATYLRGVIVDSIQFGNLTGIKENDISSEIQPLEFQLYQNYPNPFNPNTTITYSLQNNLPVELAVFDLSGKIVAELINEFQSTGKHQIIFNSSGLSSGIYVYKLKSGNQFLTKKMLLIK